MNAENRQRPTMEKLHDYEKKHSASSGMLQFVVLCHVERSETSHARLYMLITRSFALLRMT